MRDADSYGSGSGGTPPPQRDSWVGVAVLAVLLTFIIALTIVLRTT